MVETQHIGLDIGHSTTKITLDTDQGVAQIIIPSVATPAVPIFDEKEKELAEIETVNIGQNQNWFIGNTARVQGGGRLSEGHNDDWIGTSQFKALLKGAVKFADLLKPKGAGGRKIVSGLPADSFKKDKNRMESIILSAFKGEDVELKIIPQPMGVIYSASLTEEGKSRQNSIINVRDDNVIVVDIGRYTTDLYHVIEGRPVSSSMRSTLGTYLVIRSIVDALAQVGVKVSVEDVDRAIVSGKIPAKVVRSGIDLEAMIEQGFSRLADSVHDFIVSSMGESQMSSIDTILLSGGGSVPVSAELERTFDIFVNHVKDDIRQITPDIIKKIGGDVKQRDKARMTISAGYYKLAKIL